MTQGNTQPAWRAALNWLPGVGFSLLAIFVLSRVVTWQQVVGALKAIDIRVIAPAIGLYFLGMLTRALAWQTILQRKVSYWKAFFALNEGYLLNNIFPLRLGELGRAVLLGRSSGLGMLKVLSTIVVERSFDLVLSAGLLLATLPLALNMNWARPVAWAILLLVGAGLAGLALASRNRSRLIERVSHFKLAQTGLGKWVLPKIDALLGGFAALTDPRLFLLSLGLLALSWTFAMSEDWFLLSGFLHQPPFWWAGFVIGVTALGGALPSSSGAVGVLEAAVVTALVILKVDQSTALAYGIVMHVIHFTLSSATGMIGLAREGESLSGIYHQLVLRRTSPD